MSFISVDLLSLSHQIKLLEKIRGSVYETIDRTEAVIRSISYMELHGAEDELQIVFRRMLDSADNIDMLICKLRRILELYNECETEIVKLVDDLPLNMSVFSTAKMFSAVRKENMIDINNFAYVLGGNSYVSHSVVNDDWLNDLIY